ncbi:MAG: penicillin-binding protein 2 [Bacteroidetes bacterium]|nr:penicillin-binding protein 2 [Bacteroidota bacterium]
MKDLYKSRRILVIGLIGVLFSILIIRLFYVQIIDEEYKQYAENISRKEKYTFPSRGLILDRNGLILVGNKPIYHLRVTPKKVTPFDTLLLANLLGVDPSYIPNKFQEIKDDWRASSYKENDFYRMLTEEQVSKFQELKFEFRGFNLQAQTQRNYTYPIAAHTFGYLGEVNQKEIDESDKYYFPAEQIGKDGLEKHYEPLLRGQKGKALVIVDKYVREIGKYEGGQFDIPAKPGATLKSTIDAELQRYGEALLENKLGAIVAIEPSTGEILAMVSSVDYDPELLVGRKRIENYPKLVTDSLKPLYNRATSGVYAPGSTFKPLVALVGLQEGVIHSGSTFSCVGGYNIGIHVGCHAHRNHLNLKESIAQSCNSYYCNVFRITVDQSKYKTTEAGYRNWHKYMTEFGLGQKTGIDIPGEKTGSMPSVEFYDRVYPKGSWRSSYIISLGIGQGEISTTPLQMANFTAVMANRGYYIEPHFVKQIVYDDSTHNLEYEKHVTSIDKKHYDIVVEGLREVFITGTARWYNVDSLFMCGKTGTAQNPHGEDHSNFIAFAPQNNPKIAIAVVVENAGFGATWAAPIASLMIEKYLTGEISEKRKWIEEKMMSKDFIHKPEITTQNVEP